MRILMINNEFPPLGGGTASVNLEVLRYLAQDPSIELDLITANDTQVEERLQWAEKISIIKLPMLRACVHHATNGELILFTMLAFFAGRRLHRAKPYDVCMAWCTVPAGISARLLHALYGLPYLVRVSGPDIPGFEERYAWLYPIIAPVIRNIWKHASRVIAKCEDEIKLMQKSYPTLNPLIIPNGVDMDRFHPRVDDPRRDAPMRLLCVARLVARKGHHLLLSALKKLKDDGIAAHLSLVGTGDEKEKLKRMASELGISDLVQFRGYIARDEMPEVYSHADVFVLPSYNEGMSIAALEGMASGLALLLTRCGGADELVKDGVNGFLFPTGDSDALYGHLKWLSEHRDTLTEFKLKSRELVTQFSWVRCGELLKSELYNARKSHRVG